MAMISHKRKAIFVHIPKCAGKTVEYAFLEDEGLTWEQRWPLLLRPNDDEAMGPRRMAHLLARKYVELGYTPQWMWDDYFTFSFIRNPFHRMVSFYRYMHFDEEMSFSKFCDEVSARLFKDHFWFMRPQADYIFDKGERLLVDFVGRVENFAFDWRYSVAPRVGLPETIERKNVSTINSVEHTPAHPGFADYYTERAELIVRRIYAKDFEMLGYAGL